MIASSIRPASEAAGPPDRVGDARAGRQPVDARAPDRAGHVHDHVPRPLGLVRGVGGEAELRAARSVRCRWSGSSGRRSGSAPPRSPRRRAAGSGSARACGEPGRAICADAAASCRIRYGAGSDQRTSNPDSPSGSSSITSTEATSARLGPCRQNSTSWSTACGSPSKTASTVPSSRVPHPAGDAGRLGAAPDGVPEEDSLDPAADDDPPAGQGLAHSSSSYSEATPTPERPKTSEEVTGGDWTETQQRSAELPRWRSSGRWPAGPGRGRPRATSCVSPATVMRAAAADDDVDLLGLLVGVELLVDPLGHLEPGHGHVARAELPGVHEDVIAKPVPLLRRSLREPPDQHGAFLADHPFTTRFTSRPGTTISLTIALPSRWRWTFSLAWASSSSSLSGVSAATSIRSRSLPFTWTTSM